MRLKPFDAPESAWISVEWVPVPFIITTLSPGGANEAEAQKMLVDELKAETRSDFAPDLVAQAWKRINFTTEVAKDLVSKSVEDAKTAGFAKGSTDTSKLIEIF